MPRKRKVAVSVEEHPLIRTPVHPNIKAIMNNAQLYDTQHKKCISELKKQYASMKHEDFMQNFIRVVGSALQRDDPHEYATRLLDFCAGFIGSFESEDTHPILAFTIKWLLSFTSPNQIIRFRSCEFTRKILDSLGPEAALDDDICEDIINHMCIQLKDVGWNVRQQAILSLQRLQTDSIDNRIIKTYLYHLSTDPSPRVRQAVITSMVRNYHTIPSIIERLWDVDEKVRRHAYLQMSSYPVKAYKVSQRLTFLEQGLYDTSDMVRKIVTTFLIPQWLQSYNKDYIAFVSALKLDASDKEVKRFRKITKTTLLEIFKKEKLEDLLAALPLDPELDRFIGFDKLSMETTIYWISLLEYVQQHHPDEVELIVPELSTFCSYVTNYLDQLKINSEESRFEKVGNQFVILTLIEIIETYDLGDEIGRLALKELIETLLLTCDLEEYTVEVIVRCTEGIIPVPETRINFLVDIIAETVKSFNTSALDFPSRNLIDSICEKENNKNLEMAINSLKVKLLDLQEQERLCLDSKKYVKAQEVADKSAALREQMTNTLKPYVEKYSELFNNMSTNQPKKMTPETICKCLQIALFMVRSTKVKVLTPSASTLFKDFLRMQMESQLTNVRVWALQCGTAFCLLYENLVKDIYDCLCRQFQKSNNVSLWKVTIRCLFEILDCYGVDYFNYTEKLDEASTSKNTTKRSGRQLYNARENEHWDDEAEPHQSINSGNELTMLMIHFWETCDDVTIHSPVVEGVCRLILHGHYSSQDLISKLLLKYFNPCTEPEINQIIGIFMSNLIGKRLQECLQPALIPTLRTISDAPYESPLRDVKSDVVIKFVIDSTRLVFCSPGLNIHNTIAMSFLDYMLDINSDKTLIMAMAKSLNMLEITEEATLRKDLNDCVEKLLTMQFDARTVKYITNFRQMLLGNTIDTRLTRASNEDDEGSDAEVDDNEKILSTVCGSNTDTNVEETEEDVENKNDYDEKTNEASKTIVENNVSESTGDSDGTDSETGESNMSRTSTRSPANIQKTQKRYLRKSILVREHNNRISLNLTQQESNKDEFVAPAPRSPIKSKRGRPTKKDIEAQVEDKQGKNDNKARSSNATININSSNIANKSNNESIQLEKSKKKELKEINKTKENGRLAEEEDNEDEGIEKNDGEDSDGSDDVVESSFHETSLPVLMSTRKNKINKNESLANETTTANKTVTSVENEKTATPAPASDKNKVNKGTSTSHKPTVNGFVTHKAQGAAKATKKDDKKKTIDLPTIEVQKSPRTPSKTKPPSTQTASPSRTRQKKTTTPLRKKSKLNDDEEIKISSSSASSDSCNSSDEVKNAVTPTKLATLSNPPTITPTASPKVTKASSDKENNQKSPKAQRTPSKATSKTSSNSTSTTPIPRKSKAQQVQPSPATMLGTRAIAKVTISPMPSGVYSPVHSHGTRRAAQEVYKNNNIMTRKRNSLELVSTRKVSLTRDSSGGYRSSVDSAPRPVKNRSQQKRKFVELDKRRSSTRTPNNKSANGTPKQLTRNSVESEDASDTRGRARTRNSAGVKAAVVNVRSTQKNNAVVNRSLSRQAGKTTVTRSLANNNNSKTLRKRSRTTEKRKA